MFKYLLLWFALLFIAIVNGSLRDLWYRKFTGELAANQLSSITLILFFAVFIGLALKYFPPSSGRQAVMTGVLWLLLTLVFEFGFGRWRGHSWNELLKDYDLFHGRLWPLVLVWVAVAPFVFHRWYRWR